MNLSRFLTIAFLIASVQIGFSQPIYSIQSLSAPPGMTAPVKYVDLNNNGILLGYDASGNYFLYDSNANATVQIPSTFGPFAINDNGLVVGLDYLPGREVLATWSQNSGTTDIPLGGSGFLNVEGDTELSLEEYVHNHPLNDSGEVAGILTDASNNTHFAIYSPSTGLTQLPDPFPILSYKDGYDNASINSNGTIVVNGRTNNIYVSYVYKNGTFTELTPDNPGTGIFSYAYQINDSNQIVGLGGDTANSIWDASGNIPILSTVPDAGTIVSINNSGEMITGYLSSPTYIKNGVVTSLNSLIGGASATWTIETANLINNSGQILASAYQADGVSQYVLLTPEAVTLMVANRDDPGVQWSANVLQNTSQPVYAGNGSGDLVAWTIPTSSPITTDKFVWTAQLAGSTQTITGPKGTGKNTWSILADASGASAFTWQPGNYTFTCVVTPLGGTSNTITFQQQVGWRTTQYMVAGQVKPITDFSISATERKLVVNDLKSDFVSSIPNLMDPLPAKALAAFVANKLSDDNMIMAWFMRNSFPQLRTAQLPHTSTYDRYWLIQKMLDDNPDTVDLGADINPTVWAQLTQEDAFRMLTVIQVDFTLDASGKIQSIQPVAGTAKCQGGPTKLTLPGIAVPFLTYLTSVDGLPVNSAGQLEIPSEFNPYNSMGNSGVTIRVDNVNNQFAIYTSARVGFEGQFPNYALVHRDVPYIYTEVIYRLGADGRDTNNYVRLSVNEQWYDVGSGINFGPYYFNDISIYKQREGLPEGNFRRAIRFPIVGGAGMLQPFIESVPDGQWPTVAPTPVVQNAP